MHKLDMNQPAKRNFLPVVCGIILLLALACGGSEAPSRAPQPSPHVGSPPQPGSSDQEFVYTKAQLARLPLPIHGRDSLDPRLLAFLGDPGFQYDSRRDYDLGLENDYEGLGLDPQGRAGDRKFLKRLWQKYPTELQGLAADYHRGFWMRTAFSLDQPTRLKNNDINLLLEASAADPRRRELMRKVLYFCLTQHSVRQ